MYMLRPDDPGSWLNTPLPDARLSSMKRPACKPASEKWHSVSPSYAKVKVWFEYAVATQRDQAILIDRAIQNEM
ncbi:hypothetical protein [Corallococcus sp. M7]